MFVRIFTLCFAVLSSLTANADFTPPQLDGYWEAPFVSLPLGVSKKGSMSFKENNLVQEYFIDINNPLMGKHAQSIKMTYQFHIPGFFNKEEAIYLLDLVFQKIEYTHLNEQSVENANNNAECGFTDWELGVSKDVTNINCEDESEEEFTKKDDKLYSVLEFKNNQIVLGIDASKSAEQRVTKLNRKEPFTFFP